VISQSTNVTDGRTATDGQTDDMRSQESASRGKNACSTSVRLKRKKSTNYWNQLFICCSHRIQCVLLKPDYWSLNCKNWTIYC